MICSCFLGNAALVGAYTPAQHISEQHGMIWLRLLRLSMHRYSNQHQLACYRVLSLCACHLILDLLSHRKTGWGGTN